MKMILKFFKYQGTGNDFIIIDNRNNIASSLTAKQIKKVCNRKTGVGADGFILLEKDSKLDFYMNYFNSDGYPSSMCGNGGRCIVQYAKKIGIINNTTSFNAIDGKHEAKIVGKNVHLSMKDVTQIKYIHDFNILKKNKAKALFLDTGSPHLVIKVKDLNIDFISFAKKIRYSPLYKKEGVNINIIKIINQNIHVRSYERGIENETLSCGTGVTACAIAANFLGLTKTNTTRINTVGGNLHVKLLNKGSKYYNICLIGPTELVYTGEVLI